MSERQAAAHAPGLDGRRLLGWRFALEGNVGYRCKCRLRGKICNLTLMTMSEIARPKLLWWTALVRSFERVEIYWFAKRSSIYVRTWQIAI